MRLGEFRTISREMDNKLIIKIADYRSGKIYNVLWDMSNDHELYLRLDE